METLEILSTYELERGKPIPNFHHGILESSLLFELKSAYRQEYIVATEVTLDTPPNGSTPDLVVYPAQPVDFTMEIPAKQTTPPFITIEIQSPSQSLDEMVYKANIYFAFGVKSCWIVQPRIKAILLFSRPDHYQFFHFDDVLKDPNFNITLNLTNIFS